MASRVEFLAALARAGPRQLADLEELIADEELVVAVKRRWPPPKIAAGRLRQFWILDLETLLWLPI